jgi:alpha-beta hydrolase superfamily lysophospholipase
VQQLGRLETKFTSAQHSTYLQYSLLPVIVFDDYFRFVRYIVQEKGVPKDNIHLVGLSLGSHLAGYVGKEVPGIGRITGQVQWRAFG